MPCAPLCLCEWEELANVAKEKKKETETESRRMSFPIFSPTPSPRDSFRVHSSLVVVDVWRLLPLSSQQWTACMDLKQMSLAYVSIVFSMWVCVSSLRSKSMFENGERERKGEKTNAIWLQHWIVQWTTQLQRTETEMTSLALISFFFMISTEAASRLAEITFRRAWK